MGSEPDSFLSSLVRASKGNPIFYTPFPSSFLTSAHLHTPHARALHLALKESRVNDKFQEPLYLALELLRSGVLHSGKLSGKAWSGGPGNIGGGESVFS